MKQVMRTLSITTVLLLVILSLSACGANGTADMAPSASEDFYYESVVDSVADSGIGAESADTLPNTNNGRKIIETIDLSVQTKAFDSLIEGLNAQIAALGGYVESSNISGREMNSYDNRSADMTVRIPAEHSDSFTSYLSENSVVVNRSVTTEDVTLAYVDVESRLAALEAEKTALENLLKTATTVEDIIAVQEQLTEVIYTIESYQSQLRTYDNLIEYCTVNIYIYEVERTAVVEEQTVWQQIGTNLKNNFADVWDGTVAVFVFLVSAIPYLIPTAVITVVVLTIIVLCRRAAAKKARKQQQPPTDKP